MGNSCNFAPTSGKNHENLVQAKIIGSKTKEEFSGFKHHKNVFTGIYEVELCLQFMFLVLKALEFFKVHE